MNEHNTLAAQDALFPLTDLQTKGYAKPDACDRNETVAFDYDGRRLVGHVIARYTAHGNKRVTVATESGAVYALRAESVTTVDSVKGDTGTGEAA